MREGHRVRAAPPADAWRRRCALRLRRGTGRQPGSFDPRHALRADDVDRVRHAGKGRGRGADRADGAVAKAHRAHRQIFRLHAVHGARRGIGGDFDRQAGERDHQVERVDRLGRAARRRRRAPSCRGRAGRNSSAAASSGRGPRPTRSRRARLRASRPLSATAAGRKRCCSTTPSVTPASSAAATSASARSMLISSGFSSRTCFPAAAACRTRSRCVFGGVSNSTAAIDLSARIASRSPLTGNP